jgi:hypothetical protein
MIPETATNLKLNHDRDDRAAGGSVPRFAFRLFPAPVRPPAGWAIVSGPGVWPRRWLITVRKDESFSIDPARITELPHRYFRYFRG